MTENKMIVEFKEIIIEILNSKKNVTDFVLFAKKHLDSAEEICTALITLINKVLLKFKQFEKKNFFSIFKAILYVKNLVFFIY